LGCSLHSNPTWPEPSPIRTIVPPKSPPCIAMCLPFNA
jgi:hypothetical protein